MLNLPTVKSKKVRLCTLMYIQGDTSRKKIEQKDFGFWKKWCMILWCSTVRYGMYYTKHKKFDTATVVYLHRGKGKNVSNFASFFQNLTMRKVTSWSKIITNHLTHKSNNTLCSKPILEKLQFLFLSHICIIWIL